MIKKIKINPSQEIGTTDSNDNDPKERIRERVYKTDLDPHLYGDNEEAYLEPECDLEIKEIKLISEKKRFIAEITQNFIFKTELDRDTWLSYYFASFHSGGTKG
tara:strand:+ start:8 stop:319 length:312 start_codon:yes stop_codon:yes gene_type:complete